VKLFVPATSFLWTLTSAALAASGAAIIRNPLEVLPWALMMLSFLVASIAQFSRAQSSEKAPVLRVAIASSVASGIVGAGASFVIASGAHAAGWWEFSDPAVIGLSGVFGFAGAKPISKAFETRLGSRKETGHADEPA
jgi:hypothetical protein